VRSKTTLGDCYFTTCSVEKVGQGCYNLLEEEELWSGNPRTFFSNFQLNEVSRFLFP
jgi:hypothetical protein